MLLKMPSFTKRLFRASVVTLTFSEPPSTPRMNIFFWGVMSPRENIRYIPRPKEVRPKSPPVTKLGSNMKRLISCPEYTLACGGRGGGGGGYQVI